MRSAVPASSRPGAPGTPGTVASASTTAWTPRSASRAAISRARWAACSLCSRGTMPTVRIRRVYHRRLDADRDLPTSTLDPASHEPSS